MVTVELDLFQKQIILQGKIITYGNASTQELTALQAQEIEMLWNEPRTIILFDKVPFTVNFRISHQWIPDISMETILANTDPSLNFYRIEEFAYGNISFVDGLGSNTGYFKLENLYAGSTTAAHEFGHGLGLDHPEELDIRGKGRPGIMYPRGTWVDPEFQYDSNAIPGAPGGTMHPMNRRVLASDIASLHIEKLRFRQGRAILGEFTSVYHQDHSTIPLDRF
jgi:hypothetical protein